MKEYIHRKVYPVIRSSSEILRGLDKNRFRMLGVGNEQRDLVLMVRGDIRLLSGRSYSSFMGCINCGWTGSVYGNVCKVCDSVDMIYYFDGVSSSSVGCIDIGVKEDESGIVVMKL